MRDRKIAVLGAAAVGTVILSLVLPAATSAPSIDADDMLQVATAPQTEKDRSFADLVADSDGDPLPVDELRWIGNDQVADYWVSVEDDWNVCLYAYIPGDHWVAGASCATISEFYRSGVAVGVRHGVDDPATAVEAYLLPDDVDPSTLAVRARDEAAHSTNEFRAGLLSVPPFGASFAEVEVARDNGVPFHLAPLRKDDE